MELTRGTKAKILASGLVLASANALALPVQWTSASGGNDHWYEFVFPEVTGGEITSYTWAEAMAGAAAAVCNTCGGPALSGYLVTLTSAAENDFVSDSASPVGTFGFSFWMSGSDAAVEGTWRWVDGPEAGKSFWLGGLASAGGTTAGTDTGYANWAGPPDEEPNNSGDRPEDWAVGNWNGGWNDWCAIRPECVAGYVIEYSADFTRASAPEPGSIAMLGLALGALGWSRRRRG
jgi:hypothetical protein